MSLKPKPKKSRSKKQYPKPLRTLRTIRDRSDTERKITQVETRSRELIHELENLYEELNNYERGRRRAMDYKGGSDIDEQLRYYNEKTAIVRTKILDIRNEFAYNMETISTLRKREQVYRELGIEGYEYSRLEPTREAKYFKKIMRREFGKGMKFDIDGSHVKMTFEHWDDGGFEDRVFVEILHRMGVDGRATPYGNENPASMMHQHIKRYDGYSVAEIEVGHLDIKNPKEFEHVDLAELEY